MSKEDRKSQLEAYVNSQEFREMQAHDPVFEKGNQRILRANIICSALALLLALLLALSPAGASPDPRFFPYVVIGLIVAQMPVFILGALLAIIPFNSRPYEQRVTRIIHLLSLLLGMGFLLGISLFFIQLW
jgi:peptidoglycan/LPS O-acetylase OafA/YrhL